jgi:hypothetical protein
MTTDKASHASTDYGEGLLPIPASDRYAGTGLMFWLWCGGNILLTTFVLGGYYAAALGALGMIVVTIGEPDRQPVPFAVWTPLGTLRRRRVRRNALYLR